MLAIVFVVQKWHPYLFGNSFKILIDHQTLKHFLNQRFTTSTQQKWLLKLLGYSYMLEYRLGATNTTTDALSRQHERLTLMGLSQPIFDSISDIQAKYSTNLEAAQIVHALENNQPTRSHFSLREDLLYYKEGSSWPHHLLGVLKFWQSFILLLPQATPGTFAHINVFFTISICST